MKACVLDQFGSLNVLQIRDIKVPEPEDDEVQVQLKYAGVNPVDWKVREGWLKDASPYKFPIVPGWDGAGIVTRIGSQVKKFKVGDEVVGCFRPSFIQQ